MARPRSFDPDVALDRALETFWRHGYAGTSLPLLLDAMQISRSSFYETFGGKRDLFEAVLTRYDSRITRRILDALAEPGPIRDVLRRMMDQQVARALGDEGKGCLIGNTSVELGPHDPALRARLADSMARVEAALTTRLRAARDAGELAPGADPVVLARALLAMLHGFRVVAKARPDPAVLNDIAAGVLALLDAPPAAARETP
ncbi:TetR/AcrR family transcriptional regulator [Roseospira navarrensis]|uniref:TetR family transcriptional regulator n=1 Tax=Roseospira navarrensis TaxID=140058 RepID=A0A7X1ZCU8_9PROT|nr:TetR/AcrR family transcriptional regulator [Roseospira navarrensis]MQX36209.1 TetR family transcriptional regulator [Roseospira navarrensis]